MPHWGYALLALYVGIGLSPLPRRQATAISVVLTTMLFAYVFHKYGGLR